jgi:hypothetical protein
VLDCIRSGESRNTGCELFVPLTNREYEVFAVGQISGENLGASAERAFRDFAAPLGLLSQVCSTLEKHG